MIIILWGWPIQLSAYSNWEYWHDNPYKYHVNAIFKVMLLLCTTSPIINALTKHIGTNVCGKILDCENFGKFDE